MVKNEIDKWANKLVSTSVDDAKSSLHFLRAKDLPVLRRALEIERESLFCRASLVKALESKIRQVEKAI